MSIVPSSLEARISRVDRRQSRYVGIGSAVIAGWCAFRLIWLLYIAMTFSWAAGSLLFSLVLWAVIGVAAAIVAVGFLARAKQP
jgi:hypothetical protein